MGERNAPSTRMNSSANGSGSASPARRAKARTCAGREGFSQYAGVSPIGSSKGNGENRLEVVSDGIERSVAPAQEIQVARRAVGLIRPDTQKHGALKHESLPKS